jgi:predicted NBD/HSP70 family sugar kinase
LAKNLDGGTPWHVNEGPGRILELVTSNQATTRGEISTATGLSRSTVGQRLDALFDAGLLRETEEVVASGGRPSKALRLNEGAGLLAAVDFGEERTRIAITDLSARVLSNRIASFRLAEGPEKLLNQVSALIRSALAEPELRNKNLAGIALGLPAPVDYGRGQIVGWSIMAGWESFDIRAHLAQTWDVPVVIDNDVNLLTLAEHRRFWLNEQHLFYIKAGTGIGSGMVIDGAIHRGAQGAAGDIGHAHINGYGDPQCRCGNLGCLEAIVGGWALARDLRSSTDPGLHDAREIAHRLRRGDTDAVAKLRAAGRILGEAVAFATSLLNPNVIVLGGILGTTGEHLLAGVREVIYQRSLPLATGKLRIVPARHPTDASIVGAAFLARDHILAPAILDQAIASGRLPFSKAS